MKAMIFAAGLGTRLKPLTDNTPKALVIVAGKPILEHLILKLKAAGIDELVINVHHFANQILAFLEANNNFGIKIHISDETENLLDTGGALEKASNLLFSKKVINDLLDRAYESTIDQPENESENRNFMEGLFEALKKECYLLHNVDIISNFNLEDLIYYHQNSEYAVQATLLVSKRPTSRYLLFDEDDFLVGWINKETNETKPIGFHYEEGKYKEYAYSGIQIVSPIFFKNMPKGKYSIIDYYLSMCHKMDIQCFVKEDLKLIDIGKPETLEKADEFLSNL